MAIFHVVSLLLYLQHAACSCPEGFVLGVRIAAALELPEINYQLLTRGALLPLRALSCPCWGRSMQINGASHYPTTTCSTPRHPSQCWGMAVLWDGAEKTN